MKTVEMNKTNVCKELIPVFIKAREIANKNNQSGIGTIHVLIALEETDQNFNDAMRYSVLIEKSYKELKEKALSSFSIKAGEKVSTELKSITISHAYNKNVFIKHLVNSKKINHILEEVYVEIDDMIKAYEKTAHYEGETYSNNIEKEKETEENAVHIPVSNKKSKNALVSIKSKRVALPEIPKELQMLFTNITDKASNGNISKVVGREEELLEMYQILKRHSKSNPIVVGESGVGKTTLINALAREMTEGKAPIELCEKHILEMDLSSLMSDTKYQGDLEKKVSAMMKYIDQCSGSVILVIENIHNILVSQKGKMNVGELLKPFLARSEFACIGTSTIENYKNIEEDMSLARHFQRVNIEQPTVPETISILRGLKIVFEKHHNIEIDDAAIIQAVKMSDRYITDRFFPDKAIDIIDEASSVVKIAIDSKPMEIQSIENRIKQKRLEKRSITLDGSDEDSEFQMNNLNKELFMLESEQKALLEKVARDIAIITKIKETGKQISELEAKASLIDSVEERMDFEKSYISFLKTDLSMLRSLDLEIVSQKVTSVEVMKVIAKRTGVPVDKMKESDKEKILHLEKRLSEKLIGQDQAVNAVSRAIKRSMAGLSDLEKPTGSFLFLGSSGVGKTELCKQLAFEMFGSKDSIVRIDMSEYQDKNTVSKLIGSSKGYVDSDSGGILTEEVRKKPYSIVLFDEIEKAHPDVWNIMLQMLDEGHLTDGRGRKINFKNTIIVLTSNIGSEFLKSGSSREKEKVMKELSKKMRPELINRIDEKIIFDVLGKPELRKIARLMVKPTIEKLSEKRIKLTITDDCLDLIVGGACEAQYGARPLKRAIQSKIDDLLADYLLVGYLGKGSEIELQAMNKQVQLVKIIEED